MKIKNVNICIFLFAILIVFLSCNREEPMMKSISLNEVDNKEQKESKIIQGNIVKLQAVDNFFCNRNINLYFDFTTKKNYYIDSLDIQLYSDNGTLLKISKFYNQLDDNLYIEYSLASSKPLNIQNILQKHPRTSKNNVSVYINKSAYSLKYYIPSNFNYNFLKVMIKAKLSDNSEIIRYEKEFKLFPNQPVFKSILKDRFAL